MSDLADPGPSLVCGIAGHPPIGHGCHPGCIQHGVMHLGKDSWWRCHGFDGEGCHIPPQPDQYLIPAEYECWERDISA